MTTASWIFNPTNTQGESGTIQSWTCPRTINYQIEVWGAQGAGSVNGNTTYTGGKGAYVKGTVKLNQGDVLQILVGQLGISNGTSQGGGGGGGSFVALGNSYTSATPLFVAGGGGGAGMQQNGLDALTGNNGGQGNWTSNVGGGGGAGGTNGNGGGLSTINTGGSGGYGSGGGGYSGDGAGSGGKAFKNGGTGGTNQASTTVYGANVNGGFGGGGSGGNGGGGGGGYSGGGGGQNGATSGQSVNYPGGGGGGSYYISTATNVLTTSGSRTGAGQVVITQLDTAPNTPSNQIPSGTSASPALVRTLTPTLSWSFSDPDAGDTQSAYQVIVKRGAENVTVLDSGKTTSSSTSYVVPASAGLQPGTLYLWNVTVWDNSDMASQPSSSQYFQLSNAPTVSGLTPGNQNASTPFGCSVTPRLSWNYSDPEGDVQSAYQVKVFNNSTGLLIYDSQEIASANAYHDVPAGTLGAGVTFYWNVTVWDSTGMFTISSNVYILTNNPPAPVTLISPINTYRVTTRPVFVANIGDDVENDKQNFKIQLADDTNFTQNVQEFSTQTTQTGWEAFDGTSWVPFATGGMDYTYEGKQVCYTWQSDLTEGKTYYWRIAPIDGTTGSPGAWSSVRAIRVGDTLQFKLKNPLKTSAPAKKVLLSGKWTLPTDGNTPASLKVEVCNNGLDASPTWEDATNALLSSQYYLFTNTTKTGTDWAVDCRVTIKSNDSLGAVEFDGIGFTLQ